MKKTLMALALVAGSMAAYAQNNIQSLAIGNNIPLADKQLSAINNREIALNQVKTGKGLLVMFSCNTCPYVIKSQARTQEMMRYAASRGVGMVVVNSNEAYRSEDDSPEAMGAYAKAQGYTVPYLIDAQSALANAFGATRTPEVFLFDGSGKLVYKGAMEDNPSNPAESKQIFLKTAIDNMISGEPVNPNTTKSIGCSIKRAG